MTNIKTVNEIEMEKRLEILGQALKQVAQERKAVNELAEEWKLTANYYFDRYHATRAELFKARFRMADMDTMIQTLTKNQRLEPPDITLGSDDLDVV